MQILTCEYCKKDFISKRTNYNNPRKCCSLECANKKKIKRVPSQVPNQCMNCLNETLNPKFCSSSCAATFNNIHRSVEVNNKKNKSIKEAHLKKTIQRINKKSNVKSASQLLKPVGPYTKIYRNICAKSGIVFYYKSWQKFHPSVLSDRENYYRLCKFNFSISQFPLWFDGSLIEQYGWYSTPGSRKGIKNTNGISRDHMISINYGYLNNIDPKLISHPANCQLIQHNQNNKKNFRCSITKEELKRRIEEFEKLYKWHE